VITTYQLLGIWIVAAAFGLLVLTAAIVVGGLAYIANTQDERRYGLRRGRSRPEAGIGWKRPAVDGLTDREILARVGWVGIERLRD
jgi:hypothetical protein